jgi:glycine oxidase
MNRYDVMIAGGGLIGASIAFELACNGMKVAIFDAQEPGKEASWASAGMISPAPEGPGMIPLVAAGLASAALYPDFVRTIEEVSGQKVGYRPKGILDVVLSGDAQHELSTRLALYHGLGIKAEAVSAEQAREWEPGITEDFVGAIFRPDEASVDNRTLTQATLEAARRKGAEIFSGRAATRVWSDGERCKGLNFVSEHVEAEWTIIAAGCFSRQIEGVAPYAPVFPTKGQMAALRCEANIERVLWSEHIYLVPRTDGRIIAGATAEHAGFDRRVTAGSIKKILSGAIELVPSMENAQVEETWAGLRPDTPDHLPILGPTDLEGLLIATGHFRSGILLAPITAKWIREWVTTQEVSLDWERFSPMRFLEARERLGA